MTRILLVALTLGVTAVAWAQDGAAGAPVPYSPSLASLLPALAAIVLALTTRQVLVSLAGGIWLGAALLHGVWLSLPRSADLLVAVAADADHVKVIVFTLALGGLVGVVAGAGGTAGVVKAVSGFARTPRSASITTWVMGMLVFFDDYASTLLVGNTMRPITDAARVSREKLSFIVDSTAAPIASLALVSSWIGYEVSTMGDALKTAGINQDPYQLFLQGLSSRFYPIFALVFVLMVAWTGRDFGPMRAAERRARHQGKLLRDGAAPLMDAHVLEEAAELNAPPPRAWLAVVSIGALVVGVLASMAVLGADASYDALIYGSMTGVLVALVSATASRALTLDGAMNALARGVRSMTLAILVLVLAWGIGQTMKNLQAGQYVADLVGHSLPAWSLPTITFLLAALMALATGTSWGTMAILFPIVVPVAATHAADPAFATILLGSTSAVLAGAVFGDHCSPISDTTVLSSVASAADLVDHTRTQLPYAALCGAVSVVAGTLPMGLGVPPAVCLLVGVGLLWALLRGLGRTVDAA